MDRVLENLIDQLSRWCRHRHIILHTMLIAMVLCLPSLWNGWQTDDLIHRAGFLELDQFPIMKNSPLDMFAFVSGVPAKNRELINQGLLPWWSSEELQLTFFRPLSALTHWIDYQLWPNNAMLMHAQSIMWYLVLVGVVGILFRQLAPSLPVAGIAAILFAVNDAHVLPATWIAGRNGVLAAIFGTLCLLSFHRWRSIGSKFSAKAAPILLLASLLSAEMGISTAGFLLAYALFLDRAPWARRLAALVPCIVVAAVWSSVYRSHGFGADGSGAYVDPAADPAQFIAIAVTRLPLLVWGLFSFPPSDLTFVLSSAGVWVMWAAAIGLALVLTILLGQLLFRDRTARFWTLGMFIALLPSCVTWSQDRLLLISGIGGMGLIAQFLVSWRADRIRPDTHRIRRNLMRGLCALFLLVHLVIAPLYFLPSMYTFKGLSLMVDRASASLPHDADVTEDELFVLTAPMAFLIPFASVSQSLKGRPVPKRTLILASSIGDTEITRIDDRSITIQPSGGFLLPPGQRPEGCSTIDSWVDASYGFSMQDRLFWSPKHRFAVDQQVRLSGLEVSIRSITTDGRPKVVKFVFEKPLDDKRYRWVVWESGSYIPAQPPPIGERTVIPAPVIPPLAFNSGALGP